MTPLVLLHQSTCRKMCFPETPARRKPPGMDCLLSVSLEPQWQIWERSLSNKDFCSRAANSAQETIDKV